MLFSMSYDKKTLASSVPLNPSVELDAAGMDGETGLKEE